MHSKELFLRRALDEIPKLLTLLDRNPHSPSYGCFDRNFWHYKIIDFPSGMSQEFVWPLALAYATEAPDNPYYSQAVLRNWVRAGIHFAARSSHPDGSCDDYYPFEKASGATAFSLLACVESYKLLGLSDNAITGFFIRRADWLAGHMESGQLSNHQALIVLCLHLLGELLDSNRWDFEINRRLNTVLSWQNDEGWFQEYEGCDPGYHTLTVLYLAWLQKRLPDDRRLKRAVDRAVDLALEFVHPDGTFGGEYGSRNTNNFFSYAFELAGRWKPEALFANDQYAEAIRGNKTPCYSDDHIIGHHVWNDFLTYRHFVQPRTYPDRVKKRRVWFKQAGILIDRQADMELYVALNKGGVFKLFHNGELACADTNFSMRVTHKGRMKTAVAHLIDDYPTKVDADRIVVSGCLGWAKQKQMNTANLMILRLAMLTVGRFFSNLARKILQLILITGKKKTTYLFERHFVREGHRWRIKDTLQASDWSAVKSVGLGCDQTSIYVVMSRTYHVGQLSPFIDLSDKLGRMSDHEPLVHERVLP